MNRRHIGWFAAAIAAVSVGAVAQTSWYPGKWGANDEIGAANYMTPALALQAARLVKTGKVYSLGITVNTTTPAFPPRTCSIYIVQPGQVGSADGLGPTHTTYNDDILNCWTGIGTQLDGLGHIGVGDRYYNGNKWGEFADHGRAEEARHREDPADGGARRPARHGGALSASTSSRKARPSTAPRSTPWRRSRASRSARATWSSSTPAGSA